MIAQEVKPGRQFDLPRAMFAVIVLGGDPDAQSIVAMFDYAEHAQRWGSDNYNGRFEVVEVRIP